MPTYSYACTVCDHTFDVRQSFTDEPLTDCPVCFDSSLRKVIHPVGITFKGSGFYKTDSRSSGKSASASSASSKTSGSSSSSGGGSDSSAAGGGGTSSTSSTATTTPSSTAS